MTSIWFPIVLEVTLSTYIAYLNKADAFNKLHNLLPVIFCCISYDAQCRMKSTINNMTRFFCLKYKITSTVKFYSVVTHGSHRQMAKSFCLCRGEKNWCIAIVKKIQNYELLCVCDSCITHEFCKTERTKNYFLAQEKHCVVTLEKHRQWRLSETQEFKKYPTHGLKKKKK